MKSKLAKTLGLTLIATLTLLPATQAQKRTRPEFGTEAQQSKVRTSREASLLPLRAACNVNTSRELFITDPSVTKDCSRTGWLGSCSGTVQPATRGAWTFGGLMAGIFGTTDPVQLSNLTRKFFNELSIPHTLNGDVVAPRPNADSVIIQPWLQSSGGVNLDMKKDPFELTAIVARLDMRQNGNGTTSPTAGELHFVYQLAWGSGFPPQVFLIVEYNLDAAGCADILAWAQRFHALGGLPFGQSYNAALQAVTDRVTKINASPGRLNGSALNQVRTNEATLGGSGWQLREFRLQASTSGPAELLQTTVPQTPAVSLQATSAIATYVNSNAASIIAGTNIVPLTVGGNPFLGGAATHTNNLKWDGPAPACSSIANKDARAAFSRNTCSGCHGSETGTAFKQVGRRDSSTPPLLSGFLTGITVTDMCGVSRTFNDIERRRVDLCQLLDKTCTQVDAEPPVNFIH